MSSFHTREQADLLETMARHRMFLRQTVHGMDEKQIRQRSTVSQLTLASILQHVTAMERQWVDFIVRGPEAIGAADQAALERYAEQWRVPDGVTLDSLLADYAAVAGHTEQVVRELPSLDLSHPLPPAPWFAPGAEWTARRVLLHLIAETSQHAGHADIIRESLDGAKTMG
ncbi:MAG TPA: DinB family protein [Jatrophihabitans sp.]|nr:DinB family protein [Jatrophihabitans sp.]